jgi:hypothetical protein
MRKVRFQVRDGLIFCSHTRVPGLDIMVRKSTPARPLDRDWIVVFGWVVNRDEALLLEVETGVVKALEHVIGRGADEIAYEDVRVAIDVDGGLTVDLSSLS